MTVSYEITAEETLLYAVDVELEGDSSAEEQGRDYPDWVRLETLKCPGCSIPAGARQTCPAALSILPLADQCKGHMSYDAVMTRVRLNGIEIRAEVAIQQALRAVSGLLMALSACPVLKRLRPMAQNHLPFAGPDQTMIRFVGSYLISQYLRQQEGLSADWSLSKFKEYLRTLHDVNVRLARRLRMAYEVDSLVNGIVILDTAAQRTREDILDQLADLRPLYEMYLDDEASL